MNHDEKIKFAQELCDRLAAQFPSQVLIGGIYGSTASNSDTRWSDLEMLFVVDDKCTAKSRQILYRNCPVCNSVLKRAQLERILTRPALKGDSGWPFWMGVLSVLKVLYGDSGLVQTWLNMGKNVPDHLFRKSLEKELPGLVHESYGRIRSCKERNNNDDWYCAVLEVLFEMRDALCLLNKSWVTHDYFQGLIDTYRFELLPERWQELIPRLWHSSTIDAAMPLAKELVEKFWKLMIENNIQVADYNSISDIPT